MSSPNTSPTSSLDDWRWLTSHAAQGLLDQVHSSTGDELRWAKKLAKTGIPKTRIPVILEQLTLAPAARRKFTQADVLFFRRQLLEQSTDERIARYKASRFTESEEVVDLCCGLGGDLMALGSARRATGVDACQIACHLAAANCAALDVNVRTVCSSVEKVPMRRDVWFHIDPDRRADGRRSTRVEYSSPSISFLTELVENHPNGAIKLAPVTDIPESWSRAERQWIGDRRECKQQVVWFGETARAAGMRTAIGIDRDHSVFFQWDEREVAACELAISVDDYLYEPHATIIAGGMVDSLGAEFGLQKLAADVQYLTGCKHSHPAMSRFRVLETTRLNQRSIEAALKRFDCGPPEVKKRGVDYKLISRFSNLKTSGQQPAVLVLTRLGDRHLAIICQRC